VITRGRYFVQLASRQKPFEVFPATDRKFFLKSGSSSLPFVVDSDGHTTGIVLYSNGRYSRLLKAD
jgi:hypothetical protein